VPKVPVNYDPGEPTLTPAQQVLPTPYAPKLARTLFPFQDLSELSGTVAKINLQQAEQDNKAQLAIGEKLGNDAGDDTIDALAKAHAQLGDAEYQKQLNQQAFLGAEKEGSITPAQNAWRKVGFVQSASRRIMGHYESDLIAAQTQATAVLDKNGQPVPAKPVDQVIAETWGKYKDNAFFQDYYGMRTANALKASIDDRYRTDVANKLAGNEVEQYQVNTENEVARWATTKALNGDLTPEDGEHFASEMNNHRLQGVDVPKAVLRGFQTAAANADAADHGDGAGSEAAAMLRRLSITPLGNTTVGEDARTGPEIKKLIAQYDDQHLEKRQRKLALMVTEDNLRNRQAEKDMDAAVDADRKAVGSTGFDQPSIESSMNRFINQAQSENRWGPDTRNTVEFLRQKQAATRNQDSEAKVQEFSEMLSKTQDVSLVAKLAEQALQRGELSANDRQKVNELIDAQSSTAHLTQDESSRRADANIALAAHIEDAAPGADSDMQQTAKDAADQFVADRAAYARSLAGKPKAEQAQLMETWNREHSKDLVTQNRAMAADWRAMSLDKHNQAEAALAKLQTPPDSLLQPGNGFSLQEIQNYRQRADSVRKQREKMFSLDNESYRRFVNQRVQSALAAADKKGLEPTDQAGLQTAVELDIHGRASALLDKVASESTDPAKLETNFNDALLEMGLNWEKQYGSTNIERWTNLFRPKKEGEKETTIAEAGQQAKDDDANWSTAQQMMAVPESNRKDYAATLTLAVRNNPNIPKDVGSLLQSVHAGARTGLWGLFSPHTTDDAQVRVWDESNKMLARTDLTDEAKQTAVTQMYAATGIPAEDMLKGSITLTPPPATIASLQKLLDDNKKIPTEPTAWERQATADGGGSIDERFRASIRQKRVLLQKYLSEPPAESPLQSGAINPYSTRMFKDVAELNSWFKNRREDVMKIATNLKVAPSQEGLQRLYDAQKDLIMKGNTLGR